MSKSIFEKIKNDPWCLVTGSLRVLRWLPDSLYIRLLYFGMTEGKELNLKNPRLLNEKLQWLKLYNRKPLFTVLCDKVKVKDYISKEISQDIVIPTLGVWEKVEDIDFSKLPDKFILKANHSSAGNYICRDRTSFNETMARKRLEKALKEDYFKKYREWPYKDIPRRILAEPLIENADGSPIVDYKFYCYGGKPQYFMYSVGEADHNVRNCKFDMNCNNIDYLFKKKPALTNEEMQLPANFSEMKSIVEKLCKDYQHVRIDLYNVDGKIYFGEITFFSGAGFINIDNQEYSQYLSDLIDLKKI